MDIKIIGLDESGKYGDEQIYFSQIELKEESEADIFIDNILNSKDFFYKKSELQGWDSPKKSSICHRIIKKGLIKLNFYKLNPIEQNKIFKDAFKYQSQHLYNIRNRLIDIYNYQKKSQALNQEANQEANQASGIEKLKDLSDLIAQLYHYRDAHYLPDFCMKSYSSLYIINRFFMKKINQEFLQNENSLIKAQIDGGNLFSYWWYDLISNHTQKDLLENKVFINGIPHGDEYYLSMNLANLFSQAFRENPHHFFSRKIEDIIYDFKDIQIPKMLFFDKFWRYLKNFYFKNRVLFIGTSNAFDIIPYILHFKKRGIIYEPFRIKDNIKDYFRYFKIGSIEKNLVIFSQKLKGIDKSNIDYCRDLGIKTIQSIV